MNRSSSNSLLSAIPYGLLAFPLAILGITYYVFFPIWYVSSFGASLPRVGFIIVFVRIFDAIIDPIIGLASDKLSRKGYSRLILVLFGLLLIVPSFIILMNPLRLASWDVNSTFAVFSLIYFFGLTTISIPYEAFAIDHGSDPRTRSRFIAVRDFNFLIGTIAAVSFPYIILGQADTYSYPAI